MRRLRAAVPFLATLVVAQAGSLALAHAAHAAPGASDDRYAVVAGTMFVLPAPGVLSNDSDAADAPAVRWRTAPPAGFTLRSDGSIAYSVPLDAAPGTISFAYCILDLPESPDAQCISDDAVVSITVTTAAPVGSAAALGGAGPDMIASYGAPGPRPAADAGAEARPRAVQLPGTGAAIDPAHLALAFIALGASCIAAGAALRRVRR